MDYSIYKMKTPPVDFADYQAGSTRHAQALSLRYEVLRKPLGLQFPADELAREGECIHLGAFQEDAIVGTLMLHPRESNTIQMRQLAVREDLRRHGIAAKLVAIAEQLSTERGFKVICAHARLSVLDFYLRQGYKCEGPEFIEVTIPHQKVSKALT